VLVTTDMDVPEFEEKTVELADGTVIEGVFVSMGNPHFVILLDTCRSRDRAGRFLHQRAVLGRSRRRDLLPSRFSRADEC
jgi:diaminopimelate epimerase